MNSRFISRTAFYLFVSVLLVLVYPLDLYFPTGNQCIYFFWGIKNTGFGFLENDFLATQPDPFPLFSLLVSYSAKTFGDHVFIFWYWLLNFIYVIAVFEIAESFALQINSKMNKPVFTALFLFANSTLVWGFFFSRFFNFDLRWAWDSGFAEQGVLRGYLQPSVFGVLLLLSFMFFIKRKYYAAFISAAVAACFHANYLLVSAVFIAVYSVLLIKEKKYKTVAAGSVISLAIVLPYLFYVFKNFGSTSPETEEYIRSHIKGHLHFDRHVWMNAEAGLQLFIISLSIRLTRKTKLFLPLLISLTILVVLTFITYISGSIFLLNLTPWRISVVLVPVAVSVILSAIAFTDNKTTLHLTFSLVLAVVFSALFFRIFGNSSAEFIFKWRVFTLVGFCLLVLGVFLFHKYFRQSDITPFITFSSVIFITVLGLTGNFLHKKENIDKAELYNYVKQNLAENQQYLAPPSMTDMRIATGVPVFVDSTIFHSNYLTEWDRRIKITNRFYSTNDAALLDSLAANSNVTHVIIAGKSGPENSRQVFSNKSYTIFELNKK